MSVMDLQDCKIRMTPSFFVISSSQINVSTRSQRLLVGIVDSTGLLPRAWSLGEDGVVDPVHSPLAGA